MTHRVFVYGTLLSGFHNHERCLRTGKRLGATRTANAHYRMVDVNYFPGVFLDGTDAIVGEVYEVDDRTMERLDRLEGFPFMYTRVEVDLEGHGNAWMYIYNRTAERLPTIPNGDFRAYRMMVEAAERAGLDNYEQPWDDDDDENAMAPGSRGFDPEDYTDSACDGCGEVFHEEDAVVTDGIFSAHQRCYDEATKEG